MLKFEVSYRGLLLIGLALFSLWALRELWPVIILVITAFIFMAALLPYVEWLVRHRFPRVVAVLLVLLAIFGAIAGIVAIVAPAVVEEFGDLRDNLPEDAQRFEDFANDLGIDTGSWDLQERSREIEWNELIDGRAAVDYGQRLVLGVVSAFTIIILTAYLLVDAPRLSGFLYRFVPPGREPEVEHILQSLGRVVGGYVRGQVITSGIIGLYTLVVLLILGVDNAIAFAVLAAFVDIVPIIGAWIAVIGPVVAAFQEDTTTALIVLGLLVLYQQFEDRFLVPRVYGQTLNLPALVVLLAVLTGGELLGITGVLLALPAAAAGRVGFQYFMDRRSPGTTPPGPSDEVLAPDSGEGASG